MTTGRWRTESGGCPNGLRVERIDGPLATDDPANPRGVGAADQGAGIPGIPHVLAHHHEIGLGDVVDESLRRPDHGEDGLGCDGVSHLLQDTRGELETPSPCFDRPFEDLPHTGCRECTCAYVDSLDRRAGIKCAIEKLRSFQDERTVSETGTAFLKKSAKALNTLVPQPEPYGQDSLPASAPTFPFVATITRLLKASGSMTARFCEDLAVDVDPMLFETRDEPAVTRPVLACGRVDALDPKTPEVALASPAVPVRVLERVEHRLVGGLEAPAAIAVVTLGLFEDCAVMLAAVDSSFDSGHENLPSRKDLVSIERNWCGLIWTCCRTVLLVGL